MNEELTLCTTTGEPVDKVRAEQTERTGQHKSYIVLCPDERAQGFVRPYRDRYKHVGRAICGKYLHMEGNQTLGGRIDVCTMEPEHAGECIVFQSLSQPEAAAAQAKGLLSVGCGTVTTMGLALSETYARDPEFYGATFCTGCNKHLPVVEFVWTADGKIVGS
jgi:hypothetical protein